MQILQTCHHMLWKKKIKREVKPRKGLNPNTKTAYSCGLPCLRPGLPLERSKGFWAVELRERQASALQIHHLSLPLLISGKSVSATKGGGGGEGGRQRRKGERGGSLVGGWGEGRGLLGTTACLPCRLGNMPWISPAWHGIYGSVLGEIKAGLER